MVKIESIRMVEAIISEFEVNEMVLVQPIKCELDKYDMLYAFIVDSKAFICVAATLYILDEKEYRVKG